jgi:integrase
MSIPTPIQTIPPAALAAVEAALAAAGFDQAARGRALEALTSSAAPAAPTSKPWAEFCAEALELYSTGLRAPKTRAAVKLAMRRLADVGVTQVSDLSLVTVARLLAHVSAQRDYSNNSLRGLLRYVSALCGIAVHQGYLARSPFELRGIDDWIRPTPARGKKHCSAAEIKAVLGLMNQRAHSGAGWARWRDMRLWAVTMTHVYTGMRHGEVMWLQVRDVDLAAGVIDVVSRREHRLKTTASQAKIVCPPRLVEAFREWMPMRMSVPTGFAPRDPDCPWLWPTIRRGLKPWWGGGPGQKPRERMAAAAAQAGVAGFTPLSCRHSAQTLWPLLGVPQAAVSRTLRHTTERTAKEHYTHADIEAMKQALRHVEF